MIKTIIRKTKIQMKRSVVHKGIEIHFYKDAIGRNNPIIRTITLGKNTHLRHFKTTL